jgi:quercetin dioxygenase-like cupin family protein
VTIHPITEAKMPSHEHPGIEAGYMLSGELDATVEAVEQELGSGDAMYFYTPVLHNYLLARQTDWCQGLFATGGTCPG